VTTAPATNDEYLPRLDDQRRAELQRLRGMIHTVIPRVQECISYQMPAFRLLRARIAEPRSRPQDDRAGRSSGR
jgi:uncharacterized protein YdhG (YjbR/CyaY superfamily)